MNLSIRIDEGVKFVLDVVTTYVEAEFGNLAMVEDCEAVGLGWIKNGEMVPQLIGRKYCRSRAVGKTVSLVEG